MRQNTRHYLFKTFAGALLAVIVTMSLCGVSAKAAELHTHDNATFNKEWSSTDSLPTEAGSYYLTKDITVSGTSNINAEIKLCLNGHKINGAENGLIVINKNAVLSIYDCNQEIKYYFKDENDYAAYWVPGDASTGDKNVTGGVITGFIGKGAFEVEAGGSLNIYGGNIVGNWSNNADFGGAITLLGSDTGTDNTTINMTGGSIMGNAAFSSSKGGAIYMTGNSSLNLPGGIISNNYTDSDGGAIYIDKGTVNLNGGSITDNRATVNGGGVYICQNGSLTINKGAISHNDGGGVYNSGNLVMRGGEISHNYSNKINGVGIYNGNKITLLGGSVNDNYITGSAERYGAGIFCTVNSTNEVGGTAKIYNNSNNSTKNPLAESNIHLQNNNGVATVTLLTGDNALKDGADVRVTIYEKVTDDWKPEHEISKYFTDLTTDNCKYISMTNSALVGTNQVDNTLYKVHKDNTGFTLFDSDADYEIVPYDYQGHTIYAYSDASLSNRIDTCKLGEKVYIKIIPKAGYSYNSADIRVTYNSGSNSCEVSPAVSGNDIYYFTMPADRVDLSATFTLNKSSVSQEPVAKDDLQYTGEDLELIYAGTAENGTMVYCLGDDSTTIPSDEAEWSTQLPKGKNAGQYFIWYKSKGNDGYADSDIDSYDRVVVSIDRVQSSEKPVDLKGVKPSEYGKQDGKISGTTTEMEYSTDPYFHEDSDRAGCTESETTGLAAGKYYVRFKSTQNYWAGDTCEVVVPEGDKKFTNITVTGYSGVYDGKAHGITVNGVPEGATVKYGTVEGTCDSDSITFTDFTNGAKTVYVKVSKEGYSDWSGNAAVTITRATPKEPKGLAGVRTSEFGKNDGRITGTDDTMEYSTTEDFASAVGCTGTEVTDLAAGTYYVRIKETVNTNASASVQVTVSDGDKKSFEDITVTGFSGAYDGKAHGITVSGVPEGATVKYGTVKETCDADSSPVYTDFTDGEKTVYVKVSKENYNDWSGSATVTITKSTPAAPSGLAIVKPSEFGKSDGKITGTTDAMEYSKTEDFASAIDCAGTEVAGLAAGIYYVRLKETENTNAGVSATVVVPAGDKKADPKPTPDPVVTTYPQATPVPQVTPEPQITPEPEEDAEPDITEKIRQELGKVFTENKIAVTEQGIESAVPATKKNSAYYDESGRKITNSFIRTSDNKYRYIGTTGKSVKKAVVATVDAATGEMKMYYAGKNGVIVRNKVVTLPDGDKIFASADGTLATDRIVTSGKHQYYAGSNGKFLKNKIIRLKDGTRYYVNRYGYIRKNALFTAPDGDKRYATADGTLATNCWVTVGKKMYRCNKIGRITKSKPVEND